MAKVGIIVAMQEEMQELINIMTGIDEKRIREISFIKGNIEGTKCIAVQCGVGKVNAARITQMMIDNFDLEYIINIGAAGALNPSLEIGDIVIGDKLVQHDFDITAFGHTKGYITGVGDRIYSDEKLVDRFEKAIENLHEKVYKVKTGTIASGDIFCTKVTMKDKIYAQFGADCVEMEGAAIGQVCYLDNIPFVIIRSISDTPNGNNAVTFDQFVSLAAKRCANMIKEFFKDIKEEERMQKGLI